MKRLTILIAALALLAALPALAEVPCAYYSAHGDHEWIQVGFTYPSCTENGYVYLECATCHTQDTIVNAAYGHSWQYTGVTQSPTCTASGWYEERCVNCGKTNHVATPPVEHKWVKAGYDTPSTCTVQGSRMEECANCGQIRTIELPLIDHTFGEWQVLVAATDATAGARVRTCTMCGTEETHVYYVDGTLYRGGPSGAAVAELQQMLIDLHYLNDRADGSFGKKTEQAVKDYQSAAGIDPSGIAFPQTLAALKEAWTQAMGGAPSAPGAGFDPNDAPPFCIRTPEIGGTRIDFCAVHGAIYAQERAARQAAVSDAEALQALRTAVSMWLEEIDALYGQLEAQLPEADKALALEARDAFASMLTTQETALASAYGTESPEALRFELSILHEQATTLCGLLNMTYE